MENIDRMAGHIRAKYPERLSLHFHHTAQGASYYISDADSFWRVVNYIDSVTLELSDDPAVIEATGKAFGDFQNSLADFDGLLLHETISDFHNTKKRLDTLYRQHGRGGRAGYRPRIL